MTTTRNLLIGALATLTAVVALVASVQADSARAQPSQLGLKVYTANVENILEHHERCPGDWRELVHWIAGHSAPHVILLQQVDGEGQARTFTNRLNQLIGGPDYSYVIAEKNPDGTGRCKGEKRRQTNAIVFNNADGPIARLVTRGTWQSVHQGGGSDTQCVPNDQSRTRNLKATFEVGDGRTVTVASVHWPTVASGGKGCDDENARLLDRELKKPGYGSSIGQVVGGDLNVTDDKPWYGQMGSVGFRDAMAGDPTWTHILDDGAGAKRRIDYLLARRGASQPGSFFNPYTLTFAMAERAQREASSGPGAGEADPASCHTYKEAPEKGCAYSEHRAVVAKALF